MAAVKKTVYRRRLLRRVSRRHFFCMWIEGISFNVCINASLCFAIIEGVHQHCADDLDAQMNPLTTVRRSRRAREPPIFGVLVAGDYSYHYGRADSVWIQ